MKRDAGGGRAPRLLCADSLMRWVVAITVVCIVVMGVAGRRGGSDAPERARGQSVASIARSPPARSVYTAHASASRDAPARLSSSWTARTEEGDVRIELLPADAPGYVNNFVFLVRDGFYDGIIFHRVIPCFVAQAGDPTGTGCSSSGYDLVEEFNALPFDEGVLSMAKGGNSVSGSQFFITLAATPHLDPAGSPSSAASSTASTCCARSRRATRRISVSRRATASWASRSSRAASRDPRRADRVSCRLRRRTVRRRP